jgi:hypothetical protein
MKTTIYATILAAALAYCSNLSANAAVRTIHIQRAAANHFELAPIGAPKNTALPNFVVAPRLGGGKMWAQILESRRPVSTERGLDIVHAPRPITASKDPDLDRKWLANARALQVAPLK